MHGAEIEEVSIVRKEGAKKLTCRYRWFTGAPLREGKDALRRQLDRRHHRRRQRQNHLRRRFRHQPDSLAR